MDKIPRGGVYKWRQIFLFLNQKKNMNYLQGRVLMQSAFRIFAGYECRGIEKSIGTWGEVGLFD